MKSPKLNKIAEGMSKTAKRTTALVLAFMMVLSVFVALGIDFGIPGLIAWAAEKQTEYKSIEDFQKKEFLRIQNNMLDKTYNESRNPTQMSRDISENLQEGNDYFNWTKTGLTGGQLWNGGTETVYSSGTKTINNVSYTVLNVDTARKFYQACSMTSSSTNYLINITADLDMNGQGGCTWEPIKPSYTSSSQRVYIEGNGHTIYNLKIVGDEASAIFTYAPRYFAVKNLGFRSTVSISTAPPGKVDQIGLLCGLVGEKIYLDNVHSNGGYFQGREVESANSSSSYGIGGLIGRKQLLTASRTNSKGSGDNYIINCSTSNYVIFGGAHIGGLTSYIGVDGDVTPDSGQFYNSELPTNAQMFENAMSTSTAKYPWVVLNSYSTDSIIFSTAADSGSFISCCDSVIAQNCYSNNTIYAHHNTGGFVGRSATIAAGHLRDANGETNINSYFHDCFSTGVVEGSVAMGGFIGLDMGFREQNNIEVYNTDPRATTQPKTSNSCDVFENCFSTAMVGMDYAGKYCGGFIGLDDNYYDGGGTRTYYYYTNGRGWSKATAVINSLDSNVSIYTDKNTKSSGKGNWYINCYAAGEVGNILTVTDIDDMYQLSSDGEVSGGYELGFFKDTANSNRDHSNYKDSEEDILDYYPTGGFIGAIALDRYYNKNYNDKTDKNYRLYKRSAVTSTPNYYVYVSGSYVNYTPITSPNNTTIASAIRTHLGLASNATVTKAHYEQCVQDGFLFYGFGSTPSTSLEAVADYAVGNFFNCYYDKQTSAMREVAVGLANVEISRSSEGIEKSPDRFSIPGVKGVYTEESTKKNVDGLTDITTMDIDGASSTNWTYEEDYYPQISAFMKSDLTVPIKNVTASTITSLKDKKNDPTKSAFYISNSSGDSIANVTTNVTSYRKPVLSLATVQNNAKGVPEVMSLSDAASAAQYAGVAKAFRYCQAATATVLLDHWDTVMIMQTGDSKASDWSPGDPTREFSKSSDGYLTEVINGEEKDVYYINYSGLKAGNYAFKIQAGNTWTYNYGANGFNGQDNMVLRVKEDNANIRIKFYFDLGTLENNSQQFMVKVEDRDGKVTLTDNKGNDCSEYYIHEYVAPVDGEYVPNSYYLPGSFLKYNGSSWNNDGVDSVAAFTYVGENASGHHVYTCVLDNISSDYYDYEDQFSFKVTRGKFDEWYGYVSANGTASDANMWFKVGETPSTVTITFVEQTKITTISGNGVTEKYDHDSSFDYTPKEDQYYKLAGTFGPYDEGRSWGDSNIYLTYEGDNALGEHLYSVTIKGLNVENAAGYDGMYNESLLKDTGWKNGTYAFKIVEKSSNGDIWWGYNGDDSGGNMFLHVTEECDVKFTYNENTHKVTVNGADGAITQYEYEPENERYTLRGDFNSWEVKEGYDLTYIEDNSKGEHIYGITLSGLAPGSYGFKVYDTDTDNWFGTDQKKDGNNMTFIVPDSSPDVIIRFNIDSCATTVTGDGVKSDTGYTESETGSDGIDSSLRGKYSIIAKQTVINNGWDWKDKGGSTDIVSACRDGLMTENADGSWSYTFTIDDETAKAIIDNGYKLFAYKVVYQGDETYNTGGNQNFTIHAAGDYSFSGKNVTIHYDPEGGLSKTFWITSDDVQLNSSITPYAVSGNDYDYYATGSKGLFGNLLSSDFDVTSQGYLNGNTKLQFFTNDGSGFASGYKLPLGLTHWGGNKLKAKDDDGNTINYKLKITYGKGWDSGIDFGNTGFGGDNDGNYVLNLEEDVEDLTIYFIPTTSSTVKIYVTSSTEGAVVYQDYYLAGDSNFTPFIPNNANANWEFGNVQARMRFNKFTNSTQIWIPNVLPNDEYDPEYGLDTFKYFPNLSYAIKIVPWDDTAGDAGGGRDNKDEPNYIFSLKHDKYDKYDLLITYDENAGESSISRTSIRVYPPGTMGSSNEEREAKEEEATRLTSDCLVAPAETSFWTVIGTGNLTGYDWGFSNLDSANAGLLTNTIAKKLTQVNIWTGETETIDTAVSTHYWISKNPIHIKDIDADGISASFKVFADGTNSLGYPSGDYKVTFMSPDPDKSTECDVYIIFNDETFEIMVFAINTAKTGNKSYVYEMDESKLRWYLCGTSELYNYSFGARDASQYVYDTVRDITKRFTFTAGRESEQRGIVIEHNLDGGRNASENLFSKISFELDYKTTDNLSEEDQRVNSLHSKFNVEVIDMSVDAVYNKQSSNQIKSSDYIAEFTVNQFAPGKQWLTVGTIGYGIDEVYNKWKQNYTHFNFYKNENTTFQKYVSRYLQQFGSATYNGNPVNNEERLIAYLKYFKSQSENEYQELVGYIENYDLLAHYDGVETSDTSATEIEGKYYSTPSISRMRAYKWDKETMDVVINGVTETLPLDEAINTALDNSYIVGSRDIRLIPTNYLEAGVDAKVNVIQSVSDEFGNYASNSATLLYSSDDALDPTTRKEKSDAPYILTGKVQERSGSVTSEPVDYGYDIDKIAYGYYNLAVTSAYVSADKVGLGIYNNYNTNHVTTYDAKLIRDDNDNGVRNSNPSDGTCNYRYFAMGSAYHNTPSYTDNGDRSTAGIRVDSFDNMSMIGSTLNNLNSNPATDINNDGKIDEADGLKQGNTRLHDGQPQIYVYVDDEQGNQWCDFKFYTTSTSPYGTYQYKNPRTGQWLDYNYGGRSYSEQATTRILIYNASYDDGNLVRGSLVPTEAATLSDSDRTKTTKANYLKWTGQQNFVGSDKGIYEVVYTWRLQDGRYLEDSKVVTITQIQPGITKSVDIDYDTSGTNEITYTVSYTNERSDLLIDFAVLDVLPFNVDARLNSRNAYESSNFEKKFRVKSFSIDEGKRSDIKEVYYTNSTIPQTWTYWEDYETTEDETHYYTIEVQKKDAQGHPLYIYSDGDTQIDVYRTSITQTEKDADGTDVTVSRIVYKDSAGNVYPNGSYSKSMKTIRKPTAKTDVAGGTNIVFESDSSGSDTGKLRASDVYSESNRSAIWHAVNKPNKSFGYGTGDYSLQELYPEGLYDSATPNYEVTAFLLTGIQLACGQNIVFKYTLEYDGDPGDLLVNNAFYSVKPSEDTNDNNRTSAVSDPVQTAIVSRSISGYAWLDTQPNGVIDEGEPKLKNVKVSLYQRLSDSNEYALTDMSTLTDENGYYKFENVPQGVYQIRFLNPDSVDGLNQYIEIAGTGQRIDLSDLKATTEYSKASNYDEISSEYIIDPDGGITTHNLASIKEGKNNNNETYKYASISSVVAPNNRFVYASVDGYYENYKIENFQYDIVNMSAGFIYNSDFFYSIDVDKKSQDGIRLANVEFQLYFYYDASTNKYPGQASGWYPVYYVIDEKSDVHMGTEPLTEEQLKEKASQTQAEIANAEQVLEQIKAKPVDGTYTENRKNADIATQELKITNLNQQYDYYTNTTRLTDRNGSIRFSNLAEGQYKILEVKTLKDYVPYTEPIYVTFPYVASKTTNISGLAWIDSDKDFNYTDEETILASVGGAEYTVILQTQDEDGTFKDTEYTTKTDANGNYSFKNVPSGLYKVVCKDQDGNTYEIVKGSVTVVNPTITGVARDADDNVYTNKTAILYKKNAKGEFEKTSNTVTTDDLGKYKFENVNTGEYQVYIKDDKNLILVSDVISINNPITNNADFSIKASEGSLGEHVLGSNDDMTIYSHVTFEVINNKQQFTIPMSGGIRDNIWWLLLVGIAVFSLGGIAYYFGFKKRRESQAVKIPTVESVEDRIIKGK